MQANRLVVSAPTLGELEEYVRLRLCEQNRWAAEQTTLQRFLIRRRNQVNGLLLQLEGPRAHKCHAIWAGPENRVLFYDTTGLRFTEVQLSDSPDLEQCAGTT